MAKTEPPALVVVCDAGPLIHLDELASIDLLSDFTEVLVPSVVWNEVERHRSTALSHTLVRLTRVPVSGRVSADLLATSQLFSLHQGEIRALQLARLRDADMLLTDDSAARLAAGALDVAVHGTIGILVRSVRLGRRTVDEAIASIRSIPTSTTLHVRPALLAEIIRSIQQVN